MQAGGLPPTESSATGAEVLAALCGSSVWWQRFLRLRWLLATLAIGIPVCLVLLVPHWGIVGTPLFAAICTAIVMQTLILIAPRLLWFQFDHQVTWADVNRVAFARHLVLGVSNLVTVVGAGVCVAVMARRYRMGDLASMATVTEVGSTLFLLKQVQRSAGRPALAVATWHIRRMERAAHVDLLARPPIVVTWA